MRPTRDELMLAIAVLTGTRSTCLRRAVGCVLTNDRGHVIATGYNGVAAGLPHCNELGDFYDADESGVPRPTYPHECPGARAASGTNLDECRAVHAEANALLQCPDPWSIDTVYVTASPCVACVKLFLNTAARRIVYADRYPAPGAEDLWRAAGRDWVAGKTPDRVAGWRP